MKKIFRDPLLYIFLIFLLYPVLPFVGKSISLGTELLLWFIFTLSFNLCLGHTGLPSFGHGAFYGLGAFGAAITFLRLPQGGFLSSLIAGLLVGGIAAGTFGWLIRNKRGVYFAMLTVAFTQVTYGICWRWDSVTGGEMGLSGISRLNFLGLSMRDPHVYYYFCFAVMVICALVIRTISRSCYGLSLQSVRQNHIRTQFLGYDPGFYRFSVYALSGLFAGLAGAMYCLLIQAAFSDTLHWSRSGDVVMATLLGGGTVSFYGPIVGSIIFVIGKTLVSAAWENWMLIYGLSFVIILSFFPTGIMGMFKKKPGLAAKPAELSPTPEKTVERRTEN